MAPAVWVVEGAPTVNRNDADDSITSNTADAGLVRRTEVRGGADFGRVHTHSQVARAAFEGRRLRSAVVAHARVVDRLARVHAQTSSSAPGHQRARDELAVDVSRSRAALRDMVRGFAWRLEAGGLSREHMALMLSGLVDSALVDAPPQPSNGLCSDIMQWAAAAFRAGHDR
jgi:hypothetical protein